MWCLVPPTGDVPYVLSFKTHLVGRKAGDIVLSNDGSVSRDHAKIEVNLDGVFISDVKSKFGTYIDEDIKTTKRLDSSSKVRMKEGGQVRFGLQNNIWTLKRIVPYVCFDIIKDSEKKEILSILSRIGGKAHAKWMNDTSYLTTTSLRLTPEVLCALASAKPIVFPSFWRQYELMIKGQGEVPDPEKFIPSVNDKRLLSERTNLCLPNVQRKTLFKDKLFVFSSALSYEVLKIVVEIAGGKAIKLSESKMTIEDFCQPHVILLSCAENEQTSLYKKVLKKLLEKSHRVIPEDDISLALWKTSVAVHCNPKHTAKSIFCKRHDSNSEETYVMDTEDVCAASTGVLHTSEVIPPSFSENLFSTEDRTLSLSMRLNQSQTAPAESPHRRAGDNLPGRMNNNKPNQSTIKREQHSSGEEDMFAGEDDCVKQHASTTNIFSANSSRLMEKRKSSSANDNDILLPSPPRRKKVKLSGRDLGEDAFDLPEEPKSLKEQNRGDGDELDFLDSSVLSHHSSRLNKTKKSSTLNESTDLFAEETAMVREKRKAAESVNPPPKRPCADERNFHQVSSFTRDTSGWLYSIKKEEVTCQEDDLSDAFQTIVFTSLLRKPKQDNISSTSSSVSGKNFKKFRKVWSRDSEKLYITTTPVHSSFGRGSASGHGVNSTGEDEDQEDIPGDDSFASSRPAARGRAHQSDNEDDEFALPSYSQV